MDKKYGITNAILGDIQTPICCLAVATPILAYAGISIGSNWADFRKLGIRSIIVAIMVLFGTFIGSALIAEGILRWQGII